ncbi:MAG: o-succinylbenzoate synthase [bacterium]|nr:o-succinylbenzoate synthase [bacterium]
MRIETIELIRVAMPLVYPFRTAFGNTETVESVLVRLTSGGIDGWGEAASWQYPAYSPECAAAQFLVSRDIIAPLLLGEDICNGRKVCSGRNVQSRLTGIKGNPFAKAGFDLAFWDLNAKHLHQPLWRLIGGQRIVVDAGADFGIMGSIDQLIDAIQGAVDAGYKRVKLKYRPGWDLDMVAAVRERFPDTTFHIDCNSAYSLDDLDMFKELDRFGLAMIEQPLAHDDLIDHATLQAAIKTPICLDESITSPAKARKAIQIGACKWVNIKPGRVGGITNALAIHDLCRDAGVPCWIGGMLESAIGASHCLALATLPNIHYPSDIFPTDRFFERDLGTPPMVHSAASQFSPKPDPGIGAVPDPEMLERCTIEREVLQV